MISNEENRPRLKRDRSRSIQFQQESCQTSPADNHLVMNSKAYVNNDNVVIKTSRQEDLEATSSEGTTHASHKNDEHDSSFSSTVLIPVKQEGSTQEPSTNGGTTLPLSKGMTPIKQSPSSGALNELCEDDSDALKNGSGAMKSRRTALNGGGVANNKTDNREKADSVGTSALTSSVSTSSSLNSLNSSNTSYTGSNEPSDENFLNGFILEGASQSHTISSSSSRSEIMIPDSHKENKSEDKDSSKTLTEADILNAVDMMRVDSQKSLTHMQQAQKVFQNDPSKKPTHDSNTTKGVMGSTTTVPATTKFDVRKDATSNNKEKTNVKPAGHVSPSPSSSLPPPSQSHHEKQYRPQFQIQSTTDPVSLYLSIIAFKWGYNPTTPFFQLGSSIEETFFMKHSSEQIETYDKGHIVQAVRKADISTLRRLLNEGEHIQCSNRFGESVVHLACRRGNEEITRFMLEEANVCIRVSDDFGRTPLHDACWMQEPNFEIYKMLIIRDPDLLLVKDKRGHTPLHYVRSTDWFNWCNFLIQNQDLLRPRNLI